MAHARIKLAGAENVPRGQSVAVPFSAFMS